MWASPVTITPAADLPVSVDEAKEFVSIDSAETEFDTLLEGFIAAAVEQVEAVTGTRLAEQTVELRAGCFADLLRLPIGPVTAVTTIAYDDTSGAEQTLAAEDFELFGAGLEVGVRPVFGTTWPAGALRADAVRVTATVGYAELPKPLWTAILLMVGDLFANRETAVTGTVAARIPMSMTVDALLANYRIWL